ncbi:hypothetical protein ABFS83_02G137100 [Erythranthe nasuta]
MAMEAKKLGFFNWVSLSSILILAPLVCSKNHGNAANDLLGIINKNRTAQNLPNLTENRGLGCIALQYAQQCRGNCTSNNTLHCHAQEDDFTEIFAPNCGVELPTFGSISGSVLGCQQKYSHPQEAFSSLLFPGPKTLSLVKNGSFTQVGVGIIGGRKKGKGPYIWCVLFSDSKGRNATTFVLEDVGKGIEQKSGCYSGSSFDCSEGDKSSDVVQKLLVLLMLVSFSVQFFDLL